MVLDKRLIERNLSVKEVAFLAEQEPISILPRYTMNGIKLAYWARYEEAKAFTKNRRAVMDCTIIKKAAQM